MKNKKYFPSYFMSHIIGKEVVLYYTQAIELAHGLFEKEEFYQVCTEVDELTAEIFSTKQALTHQAILKESFKRKKYRSWSIRIDKEAEHLF